jgi:hypothetical protein
MESTYQEKTVDIQRAIRGKLQGLGDQKQAALRLCQATYTSLSLLKQLAPVETVSDLRH